MYLSVATQKSSEALVEDQEFATLNGFAKEQLYKFRCKGNQKP